MMFIRTPYFLLPTLVGAASFPLDILLFNLFPGFVHTEWIFLLHAGLYFGLTLIVFVNLVFSRKCSSAKQLVSGMFVGAILYALIMFLIFGLACTYGGGCL